MAAILPKEILLQIIGFVDHEPTLRNICLASKALCHFAREVLYRRVSLGDIRFTRRICTSDLLTTYVRELDVSIFAMIPAIESRELLKTMHEDYETNHVQSWAITFSLMLGPLIQACKQSLWNIEFDSFTTTRPPDHLFAQDAGDSFAGVCTTVLKNFHLPKLKRLVLSSFRLCALADLWYFPLDERCFSPRSDPLLVKRNLGNLSTFKLRQLWYEDMMEESENATYEEDLYHHVFRLMKPHRVKFSLYGPFRLLEMYKQVYATWNKSLHVLSLENLTVVDGGLCKLISCLTRLSSLKMREVHITQKSGEKWADVFEECKLLEDLSILKLNSLRYGTNYAYDDDKHFDTCLVICTNSKKDRRAFGELCRGMIGAGRSVYLGWEGLWPGDRDQAELLDCEYYVCYHGHVAE